MSHDLLPGTGPGLQEPVCLHVPAPLTTDHLDHVCSDNYNMSVPCMWKTSTLETAAGEGQRGPELDKPKCEPIRVIISGHLLEDRPAR